MLYAVPDHIMTPQIIIGKDILRNAEILIRPEGIQMKKLEYNNTIAMVEFDPEDDDLNLDNILEKGLVKRIRTMVKSYHPTNAKAPLLK